MKRFNNIAMITITSIILFEQQTVSNPGITNFIVASAHSHSLEIKILEAVEKHLPNFKDLTIFNIESKIGHIEKMRLEILELIRNADTVQRAKYKELEKILSHFNIKKVAKAISDFKQILEKLPKESSNKIINGLKDPLVKRFIS